MVQKRFGHGRTAVSNPTVGSTDSSVTPGRRRGASRRVRGTRAHLPLTPLLHPPPSFHPLPPAQRAGTKNVFGREGPDLHIGVRLPLPPNGRPSSMCVCCCCCFPAPVCFHFFLGRDGSRLVRAVDPPARTPAHTTPAPQLFLLPARCAGGRGEHLFCPALRRPDPR